MLNQIVNLIVNVKKSGVISRNTALASVCYDFISELTTLRAIVCKVYPHQHAIVCDLLQRACSIACIAVGISYCRRL